MQTLSLLASSLFVLAAPAQAQSSATEQLFDGHSLAGWEGDASFWSVQDGAITGEATREHLAPHTTYLVWKDGTVRDFELTLEFKLVGGNSGVQFRSHGAGPLDVAGYQADLEDGPSWSGCLYEQDGRGVVATRGQLVAFDEHGQRSEIDFADPAELLTHLQPHEWNTYTIRAIGPRIDIELNGFTTATLIDRDPAHAAREGCLALQLHQGFAMKAQFRNLRLRRFDADAPSAHSAPPGPQWIWATKPARENHDAWFGTRFELTQRARRARVEGCADNTFVLQIDGADVMAGDDWEHPVRADLPHGLDAGAHTLEVHATNQGGPGGLQLALALELEDGSTRRILSDGSWRAAEEAPPKGWLESSALLPRTKTAEVLGPMGMQPWGTLAAAEDWKASEALAPGEIQVPAGFTVERLYSVPKALQGSWVSLAFDPRGRIYACDQYGGLYRATLKSNGEAGVESVERVPIELGEAHGLLWAFDALYAVVTNAGHFASGLYRARDTNGDDQLDHVELLSAFTEQGGEHGPHSVVPGPDGHSLYVLAGNHTSLPNPLTASRVPKFWGEDLLLPRHEDPGGHAVGILAPGGWLARTDPDGKQWELVAAGMRNAYDFDFDAEGEPFTFDSDMEWDIGLPWYRPTRILHLASGAEFGWRSGSSNFPAWFPDSLPAAVDVGLGSPTGVSFGRHSNFPSPWHERLFVGDWAYGRILAVALEPEGSSWGGSWTKFASGHPLPVTDLVFGPDGALYFATGGRRASSGLYRVRWTGETGAVAAPAVLGKRERDRRRALEQFHRDGTTAPRAEVESALAAADPFLRNAARTALEHEPAQVSLDELGRMREPLAKIEVLLALIRADAKASSKRIFDELARLPIEKWNVEPRRDALRAWMLALIRCTAPAKAQLDAAQKRIAALFPSGDYETDRVLLDLLVHLGEPSVVPKALELAERESTSARSVAYAWPLRVARTGWTPALRTRYFAWMARAQSLWAGGASFAKYLANLRTDALAALTPEERRALGTLADAPAAPRPAAGAEPAKVVAHWNDDALSPLIADARHGRSFDGGRAAFARARCLDCHRIAGAGGNSGPDLTGAGARYSDRDLLEAILHPSAAIADQYGETEIVTKDERMLVGRIEHEDARELVLHVFTPAEESVTLEKPEIDSRRASRISRMPEGLLDVLEKDAVLDLFAYVLAGADKNAPAFR